MRPVPIATLVSALLVLAACGQDQPRGDPLSGGAPPAPIGGHGAGTAATPDGLPAGHPPVMPEGHPPMDGPAVPAGPVRGGPSLDWTAPEGWTSTPPASTMRIAQFDLPTKWSDGTPVQCVVFVQMGGGVQGNLDRWKGMVASQAGEPKVTTLDAGGMKVTRLEMRGAYSDGMAKKSDADAIFLGAIVDSGDGDQVFTVKLAGPRAAIEPEIPKFDALLASLRPKK